MAGRRAFCRLVAAALLAPAGCQKGGAPPPARPLFDHLLALAAEHRIVGALDEAGARAEVARIARRVAAAEAGGQELVAALRTVVFQELGFVREVDRTDLRYVLLPSVLADRKGSCVGLGTLYLVLAEALGRPAALEATMVPGHFFVRSRAGGEVRNVELLRAGEVMPNDFYLSRYGVPAERPTRAYWRALTAPEVGAIVLFNAGNEARRQNALDEAVTLYRRAAAAFPDFAEAHASLGLALHLSGRLREAQTAYQAAAQAEPNLPGLARNRDLLDAELGGNPGPAAAGNRL